MPEQFLNTSQGTIDLSRVRAVERLTDGEKVVSIGVTFDGFHEDTNVVGSNNYSPKEEGSQGNTAVYSTAEGKMIESKWNEWRGVKPAPAKTEAPK